MSPADEVVEGTTYCAEERSKGPSTKNILFKCVENKSFTTYEWYFNLISASQLRRLISSSIKYFDNMWSLA